MIQAAEATPNYVSPVVYPNLPDALTLDLQKGPVSETAEVKQLRYSARAAIRTAR